MFLNVPVDASVFVEVVVTRKSNTIRDFPSAVLQCPVVLTSLKSILVSTTVSTHRLVGLVVKASTSRAEGPGFESR